LGIREAAVKKRLERGRNALRGAMLERFADVAKKTAPGAAFVAGVTGALAAAAPGTAAASTISPAAKVAGAGKLSAGIVSLGAIVVGAAAALLGILWEMKKYLDTAIDARERIELEGLRRQGGMTVIAAVLWMLAGALVLPFAKVIAVTMYVAGFAAFQLALYSLFARQLPRVLSRRPQGDATRRTRLQGFWLGSAVGWGCLLLALYRVWVGH
jgi:hypothetical protein